MRIDPADDELYNLTPLQTQVIKKETENSWSNDGRIAYAGYYFLLGEYLGLERNLSASEELLELANDLDPNEFLALKALLAKLSAGKDEELRRDLQRLVLQYPNSAHFHALYGGLLSKPDSFELAIKELEKSIALDPTEEKTYLQLLAIYQQQNLPERALEVTKRLTLALPRSPSGHLLKAHLLHEKGRDKQAVEAAQQAYQLSPSNPDASLFYAQLLELTGQKSKAVKLYDELFSENPSLEELLMKTIALYRAYGDMSQIYARLLKMEQQTKHRSMGIEIQKTLVLWELSRNVEALDVLLKLQEVYPDSEQLNYLTGLAYEKLGNLKSAVEYYGRVIEESSFYLPSNLQSLRVMDSEKQYTAAHALMRKLVNSRYAISEIYSIGANIYAKENKFDEAIAFLKEGYAKFPEQLQLAFLIGVFQEKASRIDDCIQTMREVLHKDHNFAPALNYLGYIWAERGERLDLAEKLIKRALSIKPNDGYYMDSLGWVYYQRKEYGKALEIQIEAVKIEPDEGVIIEHLGDIYIKLGEKENAANAFEEALKKNTLEPRDVERVQKKLQHVKNVREV
jgi:tetratricopeptide (TPR) repeat protein